MKFNKTKNYKNMKLLLENRQQMSADANWKWHNDPRQFFISLSRYKFTAKMLIGKKNVLEIGAGDGFNSRLVKQEVKKLDLCDIDFFYKNEYEYNKNTDFISEYFFHDFTIKKLNKNYNAIYFLDVLEHINKKVEKTFIKNILYSLDKNGMMIIGIPSKEFQKFSRPKKESGHINCKSEKEFRLFLNKYFSNVIIFSMNDELIHTGFSPMACYLFAICTGKKGNY
jgi:2-polyprenyl-3-methyl-5-hydroxy-6-metoxy-1,4-benzoquinol methylase